MLNDNAWIINAKALKTGVYGDLICPNEPGGSVREDYSPNGTAWDYFSHDQARSRAYRWDEDGLGGICDEQQNLCFALALWNGCDPILKETGIWIDRQPG
jgi:hypothetical protein